MRAEYVDPSGRRTKLDSDVDNYLLPITIRIEVKDISQNCLYINSTAVPVENDEYVFDYSGKAMLLECGEDKIRICSFIQPQEELFKLEYHEFEDCLYKTFDRRYSLEEEKLFASIESSEPNTGINLCTFNRKIEDITKDELLEIVYEDVKYLSAVFYRPRIHLRTDSEIRPVDTVTRIGHESIKHLASHSEHWEARKANGLVPARLLARILEDDYAIYENIAAKCLVDKLLQYVVQKRNELKNISMQMPTEQSMMTVSQEQQNYFHAVKVLLKGYSNDDIQSVGSLLECQIKQAEHIISKLSECRSTFLYRQLKHCSVIVGELKPTNIFMMDKNYKYIYKLWQLFGVSGKDADKIKSEEISAEYGLYCQVMLMFALRYFNFKRNLSQLMIFAGGKLCTGNYEFISRDWEVQISETPIAPLGSAGEITGIIIDILKKKNHRVDVSHIGIPNIADMETLDFVDKIEENLVFTRRPSDAEISSYCDLVRDKTHGDRGKKQKVYNDLKKIIVDSFIGYKAKICKLILIPLPYKFLDSSLLAQKCIDELDKLIKPTLHEESITACYYLTPYRPTDYSEKTSDQQAKMLFNYGYAEKDMIKTKLGIRRGVIPITVNDVNSYRRITKILLMHMTEIDDKYETCPICGSEFVFDGVNYYCCRSCDFKIYLTQCGQQKCKKKFAFSKYPLPKQSNVKCDTINMKVLKNEVEDGFKNITAMEGIRPICPYCGEAH